MKELGKDFEPIKIEIDQEKQSRTNQNYITGLMSIKPVVTDIPTFIPRKFIDQFQIVLTGGIYYLYVYTSNTKPGVWKRVIIS